MKDVIFIINSALNVTGRSIYSNEERWEQVLGTLDSIDKYCPNNAKFMYDNSPTIIEDSKIDVLRERGVKVAWTGAHPIVKDISSSISVHGIGNSIAETIATANFMESIDVMFGGVKAKRVCKLCARYRINENFNYTNPEFEGKYVFLKRHPANSEVAKSHGIDSLLCSRCFHFDFSLVDDFRQRSLYIMKSVIDLRIDAEHAYFANIPPELLYEMDKIGVEGNIAPNGEAVYE